jgi:tetratricopeptide (TPR) repeat protein
MRRRLAMRSLVAATLALAALARAQAQQPPSLDAMLSTADAAWRDGDHGRAAAVYEEIVRRDSTAARAVYRLALLFAWRNELARAIELHRLYLRLEPRDDDGRIALARTLAWAERYDEAEVIYDSILARKADHRDAVLGTAQLLAWRGRLTQAIARYETWVHTHADDAEAWASLGQARSWAGRPAKARDALHRALALRPGQDDVRAQLRIVEAAMAPSLEPGVTTTDDSDHNRSTTVVLEGGVGVPWGQRVVAGVRHRTADLGAARATATALRTATSWTSIDGRWTLRGELGATRLGGREGDVQRQSRTEPLASVRVSRRVARSLSASLGVLRTAFDETAPLIISGITTTTFEGDADFAFTPRLSFGLGGGVTELAGGSGDNQRTAVSGTLRWTVKRDFSVAAGVRTFGYEHAASDGYFAPERYRLAEASVRAGFGGELGWRLDVEAGGGQQMIQGFADSRTSRFAQRANVTIAWRPAPGVEWALASAFANVASPTALSAADYRVWSLAVRGRVGL